MASGLIDALGCKKGQFVTSTANCITPNRLTQNKKYELLGDAEPLFHGRVKRAICNVLFPIKDDNLKPALVPYRNFRFKI